MWFGTPPLLIPPGVWCTRVGRTTLGRITSRTLAHKSSILLQVRHERCGFEPHVPPRGNLTYEVWASRCRCPPSGLTRSFTGSWVIGRGNFAASIAYPRSPSLVTRHRHWFDQDRRGLHAPFCFSAEPGGGVKPPSGAGGAPMCPELEPDRAGSRLLDYRASWYQLG